MLSENRRINIYIKSKDERRKDVAIVTIADFFQHLQNILYLVGDEVVDNEYRERGKFPANVKENCSLVLKNISLGSIEAEVELSSPQVGLPLEDSLGTFGEQAISMAAETFKIIREDDNIYEDLSEIIKNESRKRKILGEYHDMWPKFDSKYLFNIGFGGTELNLMDSQRRPKIVEALTTEPEPEEQAIVGRLFGFWLDKKREIKIDTPIGKFLCKYPPELQSDIIQKAGKMVSISGKILQQNKISINSEFSINTIDHLPFRQITINNKAYTLKEPIMLDVDYDINHDKYIISHDDIKLLVVSSKLSDAFEEIDEQLNILWDEFVKEDERNLTSAAIEYRNKLINYLELM